MTLRCSSSAKIEQTRKNVYNEQKHNAHYKTHESKGPKASCSLAFVVDTCPSTNQVFLKVVTLHNASFSWKRAWSFLGFCFVMNTTTCVLLV